MNYILKYTAYLESKFSKHNERIKITGIYLFLLKSPPDNCDGMDEYFEPYFQLENEEGEIFYTPVRNIDDNYKFVTK